MSNWRIQIQEKPRGNVVKRQNVPCISMTMIPHKCNCSKTVKYFSSFQVDVIINVYLIWKEVHNVFLSKENQVESYKGCKGWLHFHVYVHMYMSNKKSKVYVVRCYKWLVMAVMDFKLFSLLLTFLYIFLCKYLAVTTIIRGKKSNFHLGKKNTWIHHNQLGSILLI